MRNHIIESFENMKDHEIIQRRRIGKKKNFIKYTRWFILQLKLGVKFGRKLIRDEMLIED